MQDTYLVFQGAGQFNPMLDGIVAHFGKIGRDQYGVVEFFIAFRLHLSIVLILLEMM
jgi:hypothetical protein